MGNKERKPVTRESITEDRTVGTREEKNKLIQAEDDPRQKQPSRVITSGDKKSSEFRNLPTINIKVFAQISGIKPDQLAGFIYYAKRNNIMRLTRPEWEKAYKEFLNSPVK